MALHLKTSALMAAAAFALAGSAQAGIVLGSMPGAPDPGPRAGEIKVIDFESAQSGVVLSGDYAIDSFSMPGIAAEPAGDTSKFLSVPRDLSLGTSATMMFTGFLGAKDVAGFSFYWGSIDGYNTVQLLHRDGSAFATIAGGTLPPANGDQSAPGTNRRITFDLTGADRNLGGLRFISTQYAFETDNFAFKTVAAPAPEPAAWAMMIVGFLGVGSVLRRRGQGRVTA